MRLFRRLAPLTLLALALLAAPAAHATPVANTDGEYAALGRVFPDPLGGCQKTGTSPCSPNAQGNVPAQQFIGVDEFVEGVTHRLSVGRTLTARPGDYRVRIRVQRASRRTVATLTSRRL